MDVRLAEELGSLAHHTDFYDNERKPTIFHALMSQHAQF